MGIMFFKWLDEWVWQSTNYLTEHCSIGIEPKSFEVLEENLRLHCSVSTALMRQSQPNVNRA